MTTASAPPRVLIIDNHDSYTYNLAQAVGRLTGEVPEVIPVDRFDPASEGEYAAIIISPGPGHPATQPEFDVCLQLLRTRTGPVLGVCLGHQGIVLAHGGAIEEVPPAHGEIVPVQHDGTGLFAGVAPGTSVVRYHSLACRHAPEPLRVTARSADGLVMAVAHRNLPHFGVQFHPESILTADGVRMLHNFLRIAGVDSDLERRPDAGAVRESLPTPSDGAAARIRHHEWIAPEVVASHLLRGRRRAFWLDSADPRPWTGRFSVVGYLEDDEPSIVVGGPEHASRGVSAVARGRFLARLAELSEACPDGAGELFPAVGGWVGIAGYDTQEVIGDPAAGSPSDGFFMRADRLVVFDHEQRTVTCIAATRAQAERLQRDVAVCREVLRHPVTELAPIPSAPWTPYAQAFTRLQQALRRGDTYEAVLTFPLEFGYEGDPLDHYLRLRESSPAPFAAFLRHDAEVVLSASPELMLSVHAGKAQVRPIKGTLPRGQDAEQDAIARWRLASEDKFRRENLMIADLVRNDLGRIAVPGTVCVTQLMGVETYRGVHQLVTAVTAKVRAGAGPLDCLRAVFPAGSMTGAPKRRTMQLIAEMEGYRRGGYAGALGWFDRSRAELSVVIRTLQGSGGTLRLPVGGGIIIGSEPDAEFDEALAKARSVVPHAVLPQTRVPS